MKYFALIGVGGYVAPRHLKAIKETGNRVLPDGRLVAQRAVRVIRAVVDGRVEEVDLVERHRVIQGWLVGHASILAHCILHDDQCAHRHRGRRRPDHRHLQPGDQRCARCGPDRRLP